MFTNPDQVPFVITNDFQLKLLTPIDVARVYALHPHTVSKYLCGAIQMDLPPAFKIGGQWRFREDDVRQHIDRLSGRPTANPSGAATDAPLSQIPAKRRPGAPRKVAAAVPGGAA